MRLIYQHFEKLEFETMKCFKNKPELIRRISNTRNDWCSGSHTSISFGCVVSDMTVTTFTPLSCREWYDRHDHHTIVVSWVIWPSRPSHYCVSWVIWPSRPSHHCCVVSWTTVRTYLPLCVVSDVTTLTNLPLLCRETCVRHDPPTISESWVMLPSWPTFHYYVMFCMTTIPTC